MKIGIISDSHDRIETVQKVLGMLQRQECHALIHCGDLCAPFMIDELAEFKGETHVIAGNICDEFRTERKCADKGIEFHGDFAEIEIENRKIAIVHYPQLAENFALSGKYDLVCFGHTHEKVTKMIGKTLLVNPGELMGRKGRPSFAIYDTDTGEVKNFEIR